MKQVLSNPKTGIPESFYTLLPASRRLTLWEACPLPWLTMTPEFRETVLHQLNQVVPIALRVRFDRCELYCDRVLFGLIVDDTLYFKVDDRTRKELAKAGVQLGDNDAAVGHSDYAPISTEILEDPLQLTLWLEKAVAAGKRSQRKTKRDRASWKKHRPFAPEW